MHHFFEAITNTAGDSLIGYFARVINRTTQNTVTLSSDENGTPIVVVSGVENMAKSDEYGNLSLYVDPGTYHLDIYAPNTTTFLYRVSDIAMNSTKGDKGDPGEPGEDGEQGPAGEGLADVMAPAGSSLVGYKSPYPNTVTRTALSRLGETVSVKDFGATGDGVTDDRTAIQTAIDTVAAAGGGSVFIPTGTYMLSITGAQDGGICCLVVRSNVTLVGANMFTSVLKVMPMSFGAGAYFRAITTFGQVSNIQLLDFCIDGNRDGQGVMRNQGNGGNIVVDAVNCNVQRVQSRNGNGQGIQVRGGAELPCSGITVENCRVSGMSGSTLNPDGSVAIEYNGNGIGIQISQASDYKVIGNSVNDCKDNGIDTYHDNSTGVPTGGLCIVAHNVIQSSRCGIFPETSARMIISHNYISGMVEAGIAINRINSAPDILSVTNNTIEYCPNGIRVSGNCASIKIADNWIGFIVAATGAGILCDNSSNVLIENNVFKIEYTNVPLIAFTGAQAVFCRVSSNTYFNNPNAGLLTFVAPGTSTFGTLIEDWRAVSGLSRRTDTEGQFARAFADIGTLTTGQVGFNGSAARGKFTLPADGTDLATTQALANAIKALLVSYGLGA